MVVDKQFPVQMVSSVDGLTPLLGVVLVVQIFKPGTTSYKGIDGSWIEVGSGTYVVELDDEDVNMVGYNMLMVSATGGVTQFCPFVVPEEESTCPAFWDLLPCVYKLLDEQNQGVDKNAIIDSLVRALEVESCTSLVQIKELASLVTPDKCPSRLLPYLSLLVGERSYAEWSDVKKRVFVSALVHLYHIKGEPRALNSILNLFGEVDVEFFELWKSQLHEIFDYSLEKDYTHQIRAARIEFLTYSVLAMANLMLCTEIGVHVDGLTPVAQMPVVDGMVAAEYAIVNIDDRLLGSRVEFLRRFYPVHVLERPFGTTVSENTEFFQANDYYNEGDDNTALLEKVENPITLDDGGVYFADEVICESVGLEIDLITHCDSHCQLAGEGGCVSCEVYCQVTCQTLCEFTCQYSCQGSCESPCMSVVQP